jgi:hypothetical protein
MTRNAFIVLASVALMMGCDEPAPTGPTVPIDSEFVLAPQQSAVIAGTDASIRFVRVDGDSRCPADAFCIQGGDARVRLEVTSSAGRREYELHTGDMQPVRHDDLTIHLVQLVPYPFSSRSIAPDEYRVTLRVTR